MKSIPHLEHILNDECTALIEALPNAHEKLEILAAQYQTLFCNKVAALGCDISSPDAAVCAHKKMIWLIKEIERSLEMRYPTLDCSNSDALLAFGSSLHTLLPHNTNTYYLTESAIVRLLETNPPHALMRLHHVDTIKDLQQKLPLRMALAATRHTESDAWQQTYLTSLSTCAIEDFEERTLTIQVIDMTHYSQTLIDAGKTPKPWRMSHSKETGVITFFTADKYAHHIAPLLTRIAVFLHYYYEVTSVGEFIANRSHHTSEESLGATLVAIIHNHRDSFAHFTTPNIYDENLYWKHALLAFDALFAIPAFDFFKDTASLGGRCADTGELLSLNIIDVLWDISLSATDIESYFGNNPKRFLYHMQESLWYDLLQDLLAITPKDMEKLVKASLHIGDITFTKAIITSKK